MSIFTDLEKDAASVDGFVSENGLIPTRRNGPKPSYQYLVDRWNSEIAATIIELNKSRGFRVVGTFSDGFTYELFNDVGIDADGNSWIYVGAGAPNKVVAAGTVPSVGAGYEQVTFNAASGILDSRGTNVQDYIDGNLTPFKNVTDMKAAAYLSSLPEFTRVEWQGYYAQSDGGSNWGVLRFGTHTEDGGSVFSIDTNTYIEANLKGKSINSAKFGVNSNQSLNKDSFQACVNYCANKARLKIPSGDIMIEDTVTIPPNSVIEGQGMNITRLKANGDYTVIEHTTSSNFKGFTLSQTSGVNEGIGIGNARSDSGANQAAYNSYEKVAVRGFDFSWWLRASIWMSWKDCYSKSLVGIRFARNADPYDVTSDAPLSWNIYQPSLGWFHNVGTINNVVFEDEECGIYGCCMGYHIVSCTTQRQSGDKADNKILPTTEERTGIWLESGTTGTRSAWNNLIEAHYAEACRRPFYIQDQKNVVITSAFVQGGSASDKYKAPVEANNSVVSLEGFIGQDWFDWRTILSNNSIVHGQTSGAVSGSVSEVQDTSMLYENREQEIYVHKYNFTASNAEERFTIPVELVNRSHYELYIGGIYNGSSIIHAVYDVFRWSSESLTSVDLRSGTESAFNITVSGRNLVVNKTGSRSFIFDVVLKEISPSTTMNINIPAD